MADHRESGDYSAAKARLQRAQVRSVLLELLDGLNRHQIAIGQLIRGEREKATAELALAGKAIEGAIDQVGELIEAER